MFVAEQVQINRFNLWDRLIKKLEHTWKSLIHDGVSVSESPVIVRTHK